MRANANAAFVDVFNFTIHVVNCVDIINALADSGILLADSLAREGKNDCNTQCNIGFISVEKLQART